LSNTHIVLLHRIKNYEKLSALDNIFVFDFSMERSDQTFSTTLKIVDEAFITLREMLCEDKNPKGNLR